MLIDARDNLFHILCQMSDNQVDPTVKERLEEFIGKPDEDILTPLLYLIDDCCYFSLTSEFEINVLDRIWKDIGGTEEGRTALRAVRVRT